MFIALQVPASLLADEAGVVVVAEVVEEETGKEGEVETA
jgi:hypothetical protein